MIDKSFSHGATAQDTTTQDNLRATFDVLTFSEKTDKLSELQSAFASNSIRITGVSVASSDDNGVSGLITYEYKWVPSDTAKAAPRWDTGVVNFNGDTDQALFEAYATIYDTVTKTRKRIKTLTEQVKTL